MDNNTLDKIQDYIDTIPQEVQDIISDPVIDTRISEISQKYSLNPVQNQTLSDLVITTLAGAGNPDELLNNVVQDVGVSSFVAQQIIEDLENRVVRYIESEMDKKNGSKRDATPETTNQKIPEVSIPNYTPRPKVVMDEPVQAPVSVPRFKAAPIALDERGEDLIPNLKPKPNAGGIMESKINTVLEKNTNLNQNSALSKYSVDPYREPLS